MARALRQSLHLHSFPGGSTKASAASFFKEHLAILPRSKELQSHTQSVLDVPAHGWINTAGSSLPARPSPSQLPLSRSQYQSGSICVRQSSSGGGTSLGAFPTAASSYELDYSSDDESPSSSGLESEWDDTESTAPQPKTNDWRDMLQAKDRKELRAYAHAQKDSIGVHHVGKFGITSNVEISLSDALEKNELIKVKVLSNSPEELSETIAQLENSLRCVCAGRVGRVLLLYRPSKKKLEKKKAQEAAAAAAAKRSSFGGGRGRGGFRGGRSGRGGRSSESSSSREPDFSSSRQRGGSRYGGSDDDGGYY